MEQTLAQAKVPARSGVLPVLFAGFVLSGIATVIVGPMLPIFIRRWSLDDSQAGFFSMIQFLFALIGTLASSALAHSRGYRPPLVLGYSFMAAGLVGLNADAHAVALAATAAFGLGYGFITPGTNLYVAEAGGARSASYLSVLNLCWGIGAMICSPLIALALKNNAITPLLIGLGVVGAFLTASLFFIPLGPEHTQKSSSSVASSASDASTPSAASHNIALGVTIALAVLFFTYVAVENSIGIWAAEYSKRLANGITSLTTLAPMFFYAGLTIGRASAPFALARFSERATVLGALALAATGNLGLVASSSLRLAIAGVFLAGLGCASVYPIYIAWLSRWYGENAKKVGGVLFSLASLGGAAGAPIVGAVSKLSGNLRIGLLMPLAGLLTMLCIVLFLRRRTAS
jgi:MFS transporter, FHS family, glucose/mannose:H+ symporter